MDTAPETTPQSQRHELWSRLPLVDYIASHRRAEGGLTIFQHIPKTAGSSLVAELQRHIGGYHSLHNDFSGLGTDDVVHEGLAERLRAEMHGVLDQALVRYQPGVMRSMSGHIHHEHVDRLRAVFPDALFFTFLRSPVARVISHYRYQRTPAHPPYRAFIRACPTFEHYLENDPDSSDMMFDYLVGRDYGLEEGIARVERLYTFIGIQEMYPMSFDILMRLHGLDVRPSARLRMTEGTADNEVELTPELRARIEARNPKDVALYNHFLAKMRARRGEWQALRAAGGTAK
ncbi:hypothetical protein [Halodurantibacterium flavum]|uniref:Sulfotransferase family protein n=1 Tax=Halodurantibacterium flavum TaxID=1382802 RepID=A0ABW4SAE7_9RHOB